MEEKEITLRIPSDLYEELLELSTETGISVSNIIRIATFIKCEMLNLNYS